MRKFDAINIMQLYAKGSANGWNEILQKHLDDRNINGLAKIRYQIQAGMDDAAKLKMNDEKLIIFFIRLNRSLEETAKKIIRMKHPLPNDNTVMHKDHSKLTLESKRRRDLELRKFFKDSAY